MNLSINTFLLLGLLIVAVHLLLNLILILRLKKLYPDIWKNLGSPLFLTIVGDPRSVGSAKMLRFMYFSNWPEEIDDALLLKLKKVTKVTMVIGVLYFVLLIAFAVKYLSDNPEGLN